MSAHTVGPWTVTYTKYSGGKQMNRVVGPDKEAIRVVGFALSSGQEAEANTVLMAAAPGLLAICEIFLGCDERFQVAVGGNPIAVDKMLSDARAVIAKAKGEA